ncbi:MAG TPA: hypothetical protein VHB72_00600 [Candidatus Saccharimonadales bacterium]|nr:hypothetical protein [Candidatus Saccharimonadales bacterium]
MEGPVRKIEQAISDRFDYRLPLPSAYENRGALWETRGKVIAVVAAGAVAGANAIAFTDTPLVTVIENVSREVELGGVSSLALIAIGGYHKIRGRCLRSHLPNSR